MMSPLREMIPMDQRPEESHDLLSSGDRINFNLQGEAGLISVVVFGNMMWKISVKISAFPWGRRFAVGWNGREFPDIHSFCSLCRG